MWRVSDDFSGTRISYGYKLWLIAWMLLTDWTFRLEYCLQSPNGNARVDGLDFDCGDICKKIEESVGLRAVCVKQLLLWEFPIRIKNNQAI